MIGAPRGAKSDHNSGMIAFQFDMRILAVRFRREAKCLLVVCKRNFKTYVMHMRSQGGV